MLKTLVFLLVCLPFFSVKAQFTACRNFERVDTETLTKFPHNVRCCPEEILPAAMLALSFYPELNNIPISFRYSNIRTTMEAQPVFLSVLTPKRKYIIYINPRTERDGVRLKDAPFNAQVGIIGHELAHIVDYEKRNIFRLIGLGLHYKFHPSYSAYEKSIDRLTISKGLGWQLLCWADFVFNKSSASEGYKAFKRKYYLTPLEIEELIAANERYHIAEE